MESNGSNNRFIYLLNIPIVRQEILQYLSIPSILRLRGVSRGMKLLIDGTYLPFELRIINGGTLRPMPNRRGLFEKRLKILLKQTRSLRALNLYLLLTDSELIDILKSNPCLKYLNINCCGLSPTALRSIIVHGLNVKCLNLIEYNIDSRSLVGIKSDDVKFEELRLVVDGDNHKYVDELLQKCEHLRTLTLEIGYCPDGRVGIVLETLRNCRNLKMLRFGDKCRNNESSDEMVCGFTYLAACKNIERLILHYFRISDSALRGVSNLRYLKQLILSDCRFITEKGIGYLTDCENLQILNMTWVYGTVLRRLSHRNLTKLYLSYCMEMSTTFNDLINRCPSLEELFLLGSKQYKSECYRVLNVVIHVNDEIKSEPGFDEYCCITHKHEMYLN